MSNDQIHVLSLRLTFAPTNHFDLFGTILDVNRFVRHLVVKKHSLHDKGVVDCIDSVHSEMNDDDSIGLSSDTAIVSSVPFQDQITVSVPQSLQSESRRVDCINMSETFTVTNPYF